MPPGEFFPFSGFPQEAARIDLLGDSIGALICFLLAYYSNKGFRLSARRSLFLLYSGFLMIGIGLLMHVGLIILIPFRLSGPAGPQGFGFFPTADLFLNLGNLARWLIEGLGYLFVFSAYLTESRTKAEGLVAAQIGGVIVAREAFSAIFEGFTFVLLAATLTEVVMNYLSSRLRNTLYVIAGFLLLTLAHLTFILFPFTGFDLTAYVLGYVFQIAGFLFLLFALTRKAPVT